MQAHNPQSALWYVSTGLQSTSSTVICQYRLEMHKQHVDLSVQAIFLLFSPNQFSVAAWVNYGRHISHVKSLTSHIVQWSRTLTRSISFLFCHCPSGRDTFLPPHRDKEQFHHVQNVLLANNRELIQVHAEETWKPFWGRTQRTPNKVKLVK